MRKKLKYLGYAVLAACALVVLAFVVGPTSADIRLDTGDLRYRYLGVPVVYDRMAEPYRSRLLDLAEELEQMDGSWVRLDGYPPKTSNNVDRMCWSMYVKLSAWAVEDRQVAVELAEGLVGWIRTTRAGHGLPDNNSLYWLVEFDESVGDFRVIDHWRSHEDAIYFLAE